MKKIFIYLTILSSLALAGEQRLKTDLIMSAKNKEVKEQIYLENNIYKVYAKPLVATAINFRDTEQIKSVVFGDSYYWNAINQGNQLIIKPLEYGVSTNLFVTTDRGKYYFNVVSAKEGSNIFNPVINFIYPQDEIAKQNKLLEQKKYEIPLKVTNIEDMNFQYRWKKNLEWSPISISDDGERTYIYFSEKTEDVPAFYMKGNDGKPSIIMANIKTNPSGQRVMMINRTFKEGYLRLNSKDIKIINQQRVQRRDK